MDSALRKLVAERADGCCEYCGIHEDELGVKHWIDRIIAGQHGGTYVPENTALACFRCNGHKLSNLSSIDPETGDIVTLFHPREENWHEHFRFEGPVIVGLTPKGRATAALLQMNAEERIRLRQTLGYGETLD